MEPVDLTDPESLRTDRPEIDLIHGATLRPEPIRWYWRGWLAAGKLHVLAGAPGTGKTTLALALAATITTGARWPDGTQAPAGNVLVWSGEDDPRNTLAPRLIAAGADMARVYIVGDVFEAGRRRAFDPASDVTPLMRQAAKIGDIALLLVDPIVSAITGDSHKNAEVRRGLAPLVDLGGSLGAAVLGISHFTKGTAGRDPVERVTGSLAFGALARIVLAAAKLPDGDHEGGSRIFCRSKSNIGQDDGGYRYDLESVELAEYPDIFTTRIRWGTQQSGSARELLRHAETTTDPDERTERDEAKEFLQSLLADGPIPARQVRAECEGAGHSWGAVRRAMKELGVESVKEGGRFGQIKQQWVWVLPSAENQNVLKNPTSCPQKSVSTFTESEHLQTVPGDEIEVEL